MTELAGAPELGVSFEDLEGDPADHVVVDLARVNERVTRLADDQSADIARRLDARGRPGGPRARPPAPARARVVVELARRGHRDDRGRRVLLATGAAPRTLPAAEPDGERILTWEQVYDLTELPDAADRRRLRRHRRRVRQRLHGARHRRRPGLLARPGAARRGRRRRRRCSRTCSPGAAWRCSRARGCSRSNRDGDEVTVTLTDGRTVDRLALPARARLGAAHRATSASRRPASTLDDRGLRAASTGSPVRRPAASTPPATAPAC